MVPTAMPSWWRATEFCTTTAFIDGIGPKPSPIRNKSTSNDHSVRLSAHSASNSTEAIATTMAAIGSRL